MSQKENTRASQEKKDNQAPVKKWQNLRESFFSGDRFFRVFLLAETVLFWRFGDTDRSKKQVPGGFWVRKSHSFGIPVRIWGAGESKWPFKFDLGVAVIGQNEILAGSGSFIRLNIFVPEGFGRFGTALHDFAIRLAIWGCRGP